MQQYKQYFLKQRSLIKHMFSKGDYVTTVIGSKELTRFEHGQIINNPILHGRNRDGSEDIEEPFLAIRILGDNKIIFAHQDDTVPGLYF